MTSPVFDLAKYPAHLQALCRRPEPKWLSSDWENEEDDDYGEDVTAVFSLTQADIPHLVEIAGFIAQADNKLPQSCSFAASNAWEAISWLGTGELLPSLLKILDGINWNFIENGWIFIRFAIANCGVDHVDELISVFQDETRVDAMRGKIAYALTDIQEKRPEYRAVVIKALVAEISRFAIGRREFYGTLARALLEIKAQEALPSIRSAWSKGLIDFLDDDLLEENGWVKDASYDSMEKELRKVSEIVDAMRYCNDKFPREAILEARRHREMILPSLIEGLCEAITYVRRDIPVDSTLSLFAVHLFAEFQAKETLPYVLESLSLTDDQAWNLYLDSLGESMPGIVYRLVGDDFAFYDGRIQNAETPYVLRRCLLHSLCYLVKNGALTKAALTSALRNYFRIAMDEADSEWVTDVLDLLLDCGDSSDMPSVVEAFEKGMFEKEFVDLAKALQILSGVESQFEQGIERRTASDFTDTIAEMSTWAWFDPAQTPALTPTVTFPKPGLPISSMPPYPQKPSPFLNMDLFPTKPKKVGRNDPCPCGSGKKYKKCCLRRCR